MNKGRKGKLRSYLLEVAATNTFEGRHVILNTTDDIINMGLSPTSLRSVACSDHPYAKGFKVTAIARTTGTIPGQQEVINFFRQFPTLFSLRHRPVIGVVQSGLYAGKTVAMFSGSEMHQYFSIDLFRRVVRLRGVYQGVRWRYAKSYSEAQPHYCHPENWLILNVLRDHVDSQHSGPTQEESDQFYHHVCWAAERLSQMGKALTQRQPLERDGLITLVNIYNHLVDCSISRYHQRKLVLPLRTLRSYIMGETLPWPTNLALCLTWLNDIIALWGEEESRLKEGNNASE